MVVGAQDTLVPPLIQAVLVVVARILLVKLLAVLAQQGRAMLVVMVQTLLLKLAAVAAVQVVQGLQAFTLGVQEEQV